MAARRPVLRLCHRVWSEQARSFKDAPEVRSFSASTASHCHVGPRVHTARSSNSLINPAQRIDVEFSGCSQRRSVHDAASSRQELSKSWFEKFPLPDLSRLRQKIILPNGQKIFFDDLGRADGVPVFWLHGFPSSGSEGISVHDMAYKLGIRLICPDRPGMGMSSPWLAGRQLASNSDLLPSFFPIAEYPKQLAALAYHLNLGTFGVSGGSGGGPYAVSCANSLQREIDALTDDDIRRLVHANLAYDEGFDPPLSNKEEMIMAAMPTRKPRLTSVAVVAGIGPYAVVGTRGMRLLGHVIWNFNSYFPTLSRMGMHHYHRAVARAAKDDGKGMEEQFRKTMTKLPTEEERKKMSHPAIIAMMVHVFRAAFAQPDGPFTESRAITNRRGWGFDLEDVDFTAPDGKGVRFYYGSADVNTPLLHGQEMTKRVKGSVLDIAEGSSHWSLKDEYIEKTFRDMLAAMGESPDKSTMDAETPGEDYIFSILEVLKKRERELKSSSQR